MVHRSMATPFRTVAAPLTPDKFIWFDDLINIFQYETHDYPAIFCGTFSLLQDIFNKQYSTPLKSADMHSR